MMNITDSEVYLEIPLDCSLSLLNIRSEVVDVLDFEFTIKATGTPKVL